MGFLFYNSSRSTCFSAAGQKGGCASARRASYIDGSLLDSRFDSDSCGVGFVAQLSGEPSHAILAHALTALARLEHRGAVAADGKSSDGVGVTTVIPRSWLLAQTGLTLAAEKPLGVGVVFLPADDAAQRAEIDAALAAQNLEVLGWRPVPVRPEVLGEIANSSRPSIWTYWSPAGIPRISIAGSTWRASSLSARVCLATWPASRRPRWSTRRFAPADCWPSSIPT